MTLSREERLENIDLAMRRLMELLEDHFIEDINFRRPSEDFDGIYETTWAELDSRYWIRPISSTLESNFYFRLTGYGWIEGLKRTNRIEAILDILPGLCAAAKEHVKGRTSDQAVNRHQLAEAAKLDSRLVGNIVESRLLQEQFPDREMSLSWWDPTSTDFVRIPLSFGMERL
jgi:hypothetical protein